MVSATMSIYEEKTHVLGACDVLDGTKGVDSYIHCVCCGASPSIH